MTFRQLIAFAAVARHMNITKAAKELRASQTALLAAAKDGDGSGQNAAEEPAN